MKVSPLGLTTANYPDFSAGMDSDMENTMLYAELRDLMRKIVTQSDVNQQRALRRLANLNSALNQYQRFVGVNDQNRVGQEFTSRFSSQLTRFLNALAEDGKQRQSVRDRKSQLHIWRATFQEARLAANDPSGQRSRLAGTLIQLFEERGYSASHIAQQVAIPYSTLKRWLAGDAPNKRSVTSLVRLERFLGLEESSLSKLVTWSPGARRLQKAPDRAPAISYRARLRVLSQTPYALKKPTPKLIADWAELLKYKTDPYTRFARQKRGLWVTRPTSELSPEQVTKFTSVGVLAAPTAYIAWEKTSQFIGFLQLPAEKGGLGLSSEECHSLSVFVNADYVIRYVNFKTSRSEGIQHGGITSFLQFAKSLIHPKTGFVTQHPMFAHDAGLSPEQWHSKCADAFTVIKELHHTAHTNRQLSRNPWEPIQSLVALRNPLAPIFEAIRTLQEDINRQESSSKIRAVLVRNLLLLKLLIANPLRARNLKAMKYRPDNSGNLYRTSNGSWRIRFVPQAFKNFQGAAKDRPYDMEIDASVWPTIEEWLFESKPLIESVPSDFVFISSDKSGQGKPWKTLNREVAAITKRYVANCSGIGPHAFRHLVATTWLKANQRDYLTVAVLLHDKLETVIANYSHLSVDDGFHQWRQFLGECVQGDGNTGSQAKLQSHK